MVYKVGKFYFYAISLEKLMSFWAPMKKQVIAYFVTSRRQYSDHHVTEEEVATVIDGHFILFRSFLWIIVNLSTIDRYQLLCLSTCKLSGNALYVFNWMNKHNCANIYQCRSISFLADNVACGKPLYAPTASNRVLISRIVGGFEVVPHSWPWQVSVQFKDPESGEFGHGCGGMVIIDSKYVLTAAHCLWVNLYNCSFSIQVTLQSVVTTDQNPL